ncbi:MAG TPA: nucleotidyltransferase family protein [Candidatus Bathyarchaeia archaeon]|nr:nucleotidyltransferase family protein [Candidatus Bathyarchaeia archaeon]
MSDRREARLILAVLSGRWDEVDAVAGGVDASGFVALARACDVAPTLHAALAAAGRLERLPGEAARGLAAARAKARHDNLLLLARLETALDLLLAASIVPVALKGVDTLHRFYASFDERTLDDVDLLVPREKRDLAIRTLEAAGWAGPSEPERTHWLRSSFEMPLVSPGPVGVAFEIHWGLGQARRYRIEAAEILARAVPTQIAGRALLRLDDHDAVAHLLLHHVQHYFDRRLKWTVEIGRIAASPGFSWTLVRERLLAWGGLGAAGLALLHVRKLFPGLLPDEAYEAIPAEGWRRAVTLPLRVSHPLDFYRGTRRRFVQLWIAAAALESPSQLPGYLVHRATRDARAEEG